MITNPNYLHKASCVKMSVMSRRKSFIPATVQKSCGKNRYNSRKEAETVASEQEILFNQENLELKAYRCSSCGGWHLTRNDATRYI